jgi:predicted Zn-dependent protease
MNLRRALLCSAIALTACGTPHSQQVRNEARDRYDRANAQVVYDQALQAFHAGQFEEALTSIDKAIARFPKEGTYPLLRGRILLEMKRVDLARESFAKAIELSPQAAEPHYYMGIVLQRWNELDKAAASYAKAAELAPSQLQYVAAECETLIADGRLDDAECRLDAVSKTFEFSPVLDRVRADLASQRGDLEDRARWLDAARLRTEVAKAGPLAEEIAICRFSQGQWAECIRALEDEALAGASSTRPDLIRMRARCLLMLDRARDARDLMVTLREQVDADGRNATIMGLAAMRIGDATRMSEAGRTLTQCQPGRCDGWLLLGVAALERGDRDEATRMLREASAREPSRELPRRLLAQLESADAGGYRAMAQP